MSYSQRQRFGQSPSQGVLCVNSSPGGVLTPDQLKRITKHHYSVQGRSFLEQYMQGFWQWLVEKIPLWWAPNALTLVGLITNIGTASILMLYSPDGVAKCPWWSYLLCAAGMFIYQSLDAIDGKQARRTNSSSPLGELFDHGCDALATLFITISGCITMGMGTWPSVMFYECLAGVFIFYSAHWQTYCSGSLHFGWFDVTESQFVGMFMYVLTAFNPSVWDAEFLSTGLPVRVIPVIISVPVALNSFFRYFRVVFTGGVGKNGSTVAGTSVLSPGIPIALLITAAIVARNYSTLMIYERHPVFFLISFGFAASKLSICLVISHMTQTPMCLIDSSLLAPLLVACNQYFGIGINEYVLLWICFIYCLADLMYYTISVCRELCNYLDIYCFRISVANSAATPAAAGTAAAGSGGTVNSAAAAAARQSKSRETGAYVSPSSNGRRH